MLFKEVPVAWWVILVPTKINFASSILKSAYTGRDFFLHTKIIGGKRGSVS